MNRIKTFSLALLIAGTAMTAQAIDMGAIVKAQVILGQVDQVMDKYKEVQDLLNAGKIELKVKQPIEDASGKYLLPFDSEGNATAWAEKALTAKAGAAIGAKAGEKAMGMLAAKIPFGGLLGGAAKSKSKEMGAVMAIGGWDFIKENSSLSFNNLYDYSVYMHSRFNGLPGYKEALGSAMAIYPKLEKSHKASIDKAYRDAKKQARRYAKEEKKRQKELEKQKRAAKKAANNDA